MPNRKLIAYINDDPIGELSEESGLWSFRYTSAWLSNPHRYALSPYLLLEQGGILDGGTNRPVQWYFDNLLPEEGQRVLLASQARTDMADAFALLAFYGAESAGSVTLLDEAQTPSKKRSLAALTDEALSMRIHRMPKVPLTQGAVKRMSLAGAQHKLAVVYQDGALFEPDGATPSTHILKPNHPSDDYPHSVINEWFVMRLAKRVGLVVPEVHRKYVPEPVYIIDRFDRHQEIDQWQRLHVIDACQLLGLDKSFKYSQGDMSTLSKVANSCRSTAIARTRLFSWLVFNVLVGNSDAHLKNLSFLVSSQGVELAPHYDMLSIGCYDSIAFDQNVWPHQTSLAWPIEGVSKFAQITRQTLIDAASVLKISKSTAQRLLDQICSRIVAQTDALYAEVAAENQAILKTRSELAATFAGELRCLRAINHNVIREMVKALASE